MSEKLQNALNEQITAELWSANLYLSMSFYLKKEGLLFASIQFSIYEKDTTISGFL